MENRFTKQQLFYLIDGLPKNKILRWPLYLFFFFLKLFFSFKLSSFVYCVTVTNVAWTSFVFLLCPKNVGQTNPFRHQSWAFTKYLTVGPKHSYFSSWIIFSSMSDLWKKMMAWQVYLYKPFQTKRQINMLYIRHQNELNHLKRNWRIWRETKV